MLETLWIIAGAIGTAALALRHAREAGVSGRVLALPAIAIAWGMLLLLAGRPGTAMSLFVITSAIAIFCITKLSITSQAKRWTIAWIAIAVALTLVDPSQIPT